MWDAVITDITSDVEVGQIRQAPFEELVKWLGLQVPALKLNDDRKRQLIQENGLHVELDQKHQIYAHRSGEQPTLALEKLNTSAVPADAPIDVQSESVNKSDDKDEPESHRRKKQP